MNYLKFLCVYDQDNTTLYLYTIEGNISSRRIGDISIFYQLFASK